ncbi:unnamed protein product [Ilex paraguariensis]|uniref:Uncharacterized protein n=1 Tax=Ilex paraguariensis TaxID=185542 RepID=A0ABC8T0G4_9AQUA
MSAWLMFFDMHIEAFVSYYSEEIRDMSKRKGSTISEILRVHTSSNTMHKHSQPSSQAISSRSLSHVQFSRPSSDRQLGAQVTQYRLREVEVQLRV